MKQALLNLATVFAILSSSAEVTRSTEWYRVPDKEKVGNVADLAVTKTNEIEAISFGMIRRTSRVLPKYLHELEYCSTYKDDAEWYYEQYVPAGSCSVRRIGGLLERNYDWNLDESAVFLIRMSAAEGRFASIGMAGVGTNLTEQIVKSEKWSRYYKCLPGHMLDGVNENGVVVEINVTDMTGVEGWNENGTIHVLAAVRWVLDNGTSAQQAAQYLAANIKRPSGMNFHYMIADKDSTYIVENGRANRITGTAIMTNYDLYEMGNPGGGKERYAILNGGGRIEDAWFTRAYSADTNWESEFSDAFEMAAAKAAWASLGTKDARRQVGKFWQTVHTAVYDIEKKTMKLTVQESQEWHTFALSSPFIDEDRAQKIEAMKRNNDDFKVYRKVKDCWTWKNWNNPDADLPAPDDFLKFANSPSSTPIRYERIAGAWYGAVQFWPNGKIKYSQAEIPPAGTGEFSKVLNFAMWAYDETGTNKIYRFGATATRTDPTNETFVAWDETYNQFVRIATTDLIPTISHNDKTFSNEVVLVGYSMTNELKKAMNNELDPSTYAGSSSNITVKSHSITTYSPTGDEIPEVLNVFASGTRNFEMFFPDTTTLRDNLPINITVEDGKGFTTLGAPWDGKITKLPALLKIREPIEKTLIATVQYFDE